MILRQSAMLVAFQTECESHGSTVRRTSQTIAKPSRVSAMFRGPENRFVRSHSTTPEARFGGGSAGSMVWRTKAGIGLRCSSHRSFSLTLLLKTFMPPEMIRLSNR